MFQCEFCNKLNQGEYIRDKRVQNGNVVRLKRWI